MKQTQPINGFTLQNETQLACVCLAILNKNPNYAQSNLSQTELTYITNLNITSLDQSEVEHALLDYIYKESINGTDVLGMFFSPTYIAWMVYYHLQFVRLS